MFAKSVARDRRCVGRQGQNGARSSAVQARTFTERTGAAHDGGSDAGETITTATIDGPRLLERESRNYRRGAAVELENALLTVRWSPHQRPTSLARSRHPR